jgi:hypothetical protein
MDSCTDQKLVEAMTSLAHSLNTLTQDQTSTATTLNASLVWAEPSGRFGLRTLEVTIGPASSANLEFIKARLFGEARWAAIAPHSLPHFIIPIEPSGQQSPTYQALKQAMQESDGWEEVSATPS